MERNNKRFSAASFEAFPDEKPFTILGEWINGVLISREIPLSESPRVFCICTIRDIRKKPMHSLSLSTYEKLLLASNALSYTKPEIDQLADIVSTALDQKLSSNKP